jgi:chromosome segregation ATPase
MKSDKAFWVFLICVILFIGYLYYDKQMDKRLAKQMTEKIDELVENNDAITNGALDSYNFIMAQKDEQIAQLVVENTDLHKKTNQLLASADAQEAAVKPILEQYPEVAKLVFTLRETIASVQAENVNLQAQLTATQEKLSASQLLSETLLKQNADLSNGLQDIRKDLARALGISKKKELVGYIKDGIIVALLVFKK